MFGHAPGTKPVVAAPGTHLSCFLYTRLVVAAQTLLDVVGSTAHQTTLDLLAFLALLAHFVDLAAHLASQGLVFHLAALLASQDFQL